MGKKSLFDDEEAPAKEVQLKVNDSFAQRFEHNQSRMELERLQRKYPKQAARLAAKGMRGLNAEEEEDAPSSDDEEEDDGIIPEKTEAQIFETLLRIRNKDPAVYNPDAKFYSDGEEEEKEGGAGNGSGEAARSPSDAKNSSKKDKKRPLYLKDVIYQQAMQAAEAGEEDASSEDGAESDSDEGAGPRAQTYTEEQTELKNAFLQAFDEEGAGGGDGEAFGGVLQHRAQKRQQKQHASGSGEAAAGEQPSEARVQELLDSYFGGGESSAPQLNEGDRFLRNYLLKRRWVDPEDASEEEMGGSDGEDVDADAAAMAAAEAFEANYNFRFEEPGGGTIVTYPRQIEGVVRKEDDRRKRQRDAKAARRAEQEEQRATELRRLKNLKKKAIEERLAEVQEVAGSGAPAPELLDSLLEGDFDPEAHDRAMAAAFGDDYYAEGGEEEDVEDAEFEQHLRDMAEYDTDDEAAAARTFKAMQARLEADKAAQVEAQEEEEGGEEDGEAAAAARADLQRLLEEYHKLDYEDHVGGVPTRFRYKEVAPESYGLSIEELLALDDKELNQVVGLRRVAAPYREDGGRSRPNYGKLNELRREKGLGGGGRGRGGGGRGRGGSAPGSSWNPARDGGLARERGEATRPQHSGYSIGGGRAGEGTEAEQRRATYEKPTLKKRSRSDGGDGSGQGGFKKAKQVPVEQQQPADGLNLTRAQRKNMKRAQKRAAKQEDK